MTVLIEVPLLWVMGERDKKFLVVCALTNLASNLSLNLLLYLAPAMRQALCILLLEGAVVLGEWWVLNDVCNKPRWLLAKVFVANLCSYTV